MALSKMTCINCEGVVIEYYNERYNGKRGRCDVCQIDFPLE